MKIAVLCIATNFKIRMKLGSKSFLKQEDIKAMNFFLNEISVWLKNSKEELVPIIVTCFDEIYEMAIQRHFLCFKNEFGSISEGNMIRFGISSYPDAQAYFVVSTSESRFFRAEIFETLCEHMHKNPNKLIFSNYDDKFVLPMIFTNKFTDPIRSIVDRDNGKFILKSNTKNAIYMTITEELLSLNDFHKEKTKSLEDDTNRQIEEKQKSKTVNPVIIIRGGGRIASAIAFALHRFGFRIIITEKHTPTTLYRGLSFATAVYTSDIEIDGVKAFLVSPSQKQIQKAWDINAIPVIIDPSLEILQLFDPANIKDSIFEDNTKQPVTDIISYLSKFEEKNSYIQSAASETENITDTNKFTKNSPLFALIDATSGTVQKPTDRFMAPITIGLRDDQIPKVDVHVKISTIQDSQYGRIIYNKDFQVSRVEDKKLDSNSNIAPANIAGSAKITTSGTGNISYPANISGPDNVTEPANTLNLANVSGLDNITTPANKNCSDSSCVDLNNKLRYNQIGSNTQENLHTSYGNLVYVYANAKGVFKSNHKIGDEVEEGSIIGQIENELGDYTKIISPAKGRLIGNAINNLPYNHSDQVAVIDTSNISKIECFRPIPIDNSISYSVLSLLKKDLY